MLAQTKQMAPDFISLGFVGFYDQNTPPVDEDGLIAAKYCAYPSVLHTHAILIIRRLRECTRAVRTCDLA